MIHLFYLPVLNNISSFTFIAISFIILSTCLPPLMKEAKCPCCLRYTDLIQKPLIPNSPIRLDIILVNTFPVSFHQLLVKWGLRKNGIGWQCSNCSKFSIECPHCHTLQKIQTLDYVDQECNNCDKRFYVVV